MAKKLGLNVSFGLNTKDFSTKMQNVRRDMKQTGASLRAIGLGVGAVAGTAITFGLKAVSAWDEQAQAIAQVEAGLKSTSHAAGLTSIQLQRMAAKLQSNSIFGDETILRDATANLLTFTNIAGDQFARTQQSVLDLATRMGTDLKSAAIQLGKALNDPVANLSALSRSGIQFSDAQKTLIKSLWETNQQAEAQNVILKELENQFGGSAKAAADAGLGGFKQLSNTFGDLTEQIGKSLMPYLNKLEKVLREVTDGIAEVSKQSDLTGRVWSESMHSDELLNFLENRQKQYEEVSKMSIIGSNAFEKLQAQQIKSNTLTALSKEIEALKRAIHFSVKYENQEKKRKTNSGKKAGGGATDAQKAWNEEYAKQMEALQKNKLSDSVARHIERTALLKDAQKDLGGIPSMTSVGVDFGDTLMKPKTRMKLIQEQAQEMAQVVPIAFINMVTEVDSTLQRFNEMLTNFTVGTIGDFASAIGGALMGGKDAFVNFGDRWLSNLADFLGQFGEMLIAAGIGKVALDNLGGFGGGIPAIAAGIALKAFSGGINQHLSKSGNAMTGGASSMGYSSGGGPITVEGQIRGDHLAILSSDYQRRGR